MQKLAFPSTVVITVIVRPKSQDQHQQSTIKQTLIMTLPPSSKFKHIKIDRQSIIARQTSNSEMAPRIFGNLVLVNLLVGLALGQVTVNIGHVNDIHAHFEQVSESVGRCHQEEADAGACYGGMSRMYTLINQLRSETENFLLMNAGDYYSGSIWSDQLQYEPIIELGNLLEYDVFALGNHEFDDGVSLVADFLGQVNYPVVAANMIQTETTDLGDLYSNSTILDLPSGQRMGVIGYVSTETPGISAADLSSLDFVDEVAAITEEAARLKTDGVEIIVALGHSGYDVDIEIATQVSDVDLVIGGHSHSFLYTGTPPSIETPRGDYPTYITQDSGKVVPVVQAYCYTKYLGHLELNFDENGELLEPVDGSGVSLADVILLDSSIPQDEDIEEMMNEYRDQLSDYYDVLGYTEVYLENPGNEESNLGDVIADSMKAWWDAHSATGVEFAFMNNGGIRSSISIGDITGEDVYYVLPFANTVDRVSIRGWDLLTLLESFVAELCPDQSCFPSTFLQMSGLQVEYQISDGNVGNRVIALNRKCRETDQTTETWCPLELDQTWDFALGSYMVEGGSRMAEEAARDDEEYSPSFADYILAGSREIGPIDTEAFGEFLGLNTPITQEVEGRIVIAYGEPSDYEGTSGASFGRFDFNLTLLSLILVLWRFE